MKKRNIFIGLFLLFFLQAGRSLAQQAIFSPRENAMFFAFSQLQGREKAMADAMKEAQMVLMNPDVMSEKPKESAGADSDAGEGLSLEGLFARTHPYFRSEILSDDRINLVSTDDNITSKVDNLNINRQKNSTIISTFTPGLKMNFSGNGRSLFLDMNIANISYNNRSRMSSQKAGMDVLANIPVGQYLFSIADNYSNNHMTKSAMITDATTQRYWRNKFKVTLGRDFSRTGFDIGYGRRDYLYDVVLEGDPVWNYSEDSYTFNQYLRIAAKTRLLFGYEHLRKEYTTLPSSRAGTDNFSLGLTGSLSSKVTGLVKAVYVSGNYRKFWDYMKNAAMAEMGYQASPRTDFKLAFKHVTHEPENILDYYIQNDLSLTAQHRLAFDPKLQLSLTCETDLREYEKRLEPNGRAIYTLDFGLGYAFRRWVDFSLDYRHDRDYSKLETSYNRNRITFKTNMRF
jgi:hypothetical protein